MKTKVLTGLLVGGLFFCMACNSRKAESGTYMSGPEGATDMATAADRAETISTASDSTGFIFLKDSLQQDSSAL